MMTNENAPTTGFCPGCGKNCPLNNLQCGLGFKLAAEAAGDDTSNANAPREDRKSRKGHEGEHDRHDHGHDDRRSHGHAEHHGHLGHHGHGGSGWRGDKGFSGRAGGHHSEGHSHHHGHGHDHHHGRGLDRDAAPAMAALPEDERLSRVFHHCARTLVHRERSQGGRASALAVLASHGAMSQAALADKLDIRAASASELLGKMEADGLVARTPDAEDGRAYRIELTDAGKAEAQRIREERTERDAELFAALDADEKAQITDLLDKLASSWRQGHHHGRR